MLYDENNNEVEGALTPEEAEELQQKVAEAEDIKQKAADLETELAEAKRLAEEAGKKNNISPNAQLRKQKEEAEGVVASLTSQLNETKTKLDSFENTVKGFELKQEIREQVGGDRELAEKVYAEYNNFKGEPANATEQAERIKKAITLASGGNVDVLRKTAYSSGAGGLSAVVTNKKTFSSEQKEIAAKLGIKEETLKKYEK